MRNAIPDRAWAEHTALFLDVDGTLIDFAALPTESDGPRRVG